MSEHIFVGPTLGSLRPPFPEGWQVWPPVRRGDIDTLVETEGQPGRIHIVDGTFHAFPAVGHKEIVRAIGAGWTVVGLCSMGAIRYAELHHMGMKGFGYLAQQFRDNPDMRDDEVTLVHLSEPPYTPLSEPLVHFRAMLASCTNRRILGESAKTEIITTLDHMWYAERTLPWLQTELDRRHISLDVGEEITKFRLKETDLLKYLTEGWREC